MKQKKSKYDIQAESFLVKHGIRFAATNPKAECPPFCADDKNHHAKGTHIHGLRYFIVMERGTIDRGVKSPDFADISFPFWNSHNDAQAGRKPTPYDVLSCLSRDIYTPDSFEEFCSECGFDTDSRKAEQMHRACLELRYRLEWVFNTDEMRAELAEIN